ncbi:hypothetical protein CLV84_0933 [Neolewinella xylanilytica]|uniref:Uncharacterized protein n=1 Tax=Neolewinella xylanilytica TaxID=1514080 RepID=A0A2S6I912_9BACT|nr:hypothetical protein [Neolewinella xylanilytica]PPK87972.1 hypothetical protein CLV84_0933 [Neolewinella xylanilytica]
MTLVLILVLTTIMAAVMINGHASELRHSKGAIWGLYAYHTLFCLIYFLWALVNNSDSKAYYSDTLRASRGGSWLEIYDFGTPFIEFLAYPFVNGLALPYVSVMFLFGFFGFIGFFYLYLFVSEQIQFRHKLLGIDIILLLFFLPIAHFYSASLGKGAVILAGMGLLFYGLNRIGKRLIFLLLGVFIVLHVRAHIMAAVCGAAVLAAVFSNRGIKNWQKVIIVVVSLAALGPLFQQTFAYVGVDATDAEAIEEWSEKRTTDLKKANSAVDIENYSQPMKLFTFLFRPLFIDSPNALGLIVSVENLIYLILFLRCFNPRFLRFIIQAPWMVKMALTTFFVVSIALAQISSNMGIAIRQKSQVTYLFVFVLLAYADYAYRTERKLVIGE